MKLSDLINKRAALKADLDKLMAVEMSDEVRSQIVDKEKEFDTNESDIAIAKRIAQKSKTFDNSNTETEENETSAASFRNYLMAGNFDKPFILERADPILTSTDTGSINKTVANEVQIAMSPAESFLRNNLKITFYEGLNGNFVVPKMSQFVAGFVNEASTAGLGDVNLSSLTLAGRRLTAYATITDETLKQTNPGIFQGILNDLVNSYWQGVKYDVFDQIDTDAAARKSTLNAVSFNFGHLTSMEASLGGKVPSQNLSFVATPTGKGYTKKTIALGTTAGDSIWEKIEWAKYDSDGANADKMYLGDFSKAVIGTFGSNYEIKVMQDVDGAKKGIYTAVISGLVDTGCVLPEAFVIADVSAKL